MECIGFGDPHVFEQSGNNATKSENNSDAPQLWREDPTVRTPETLDDLSMQPHNNSWLEGGDFSRTPPIPSSDVVLEQR
jgi:hypothetical protein